MSPLERPRQSANFARPQSDGCAFLCLEASEGSVGGPKILTMHEISVQHLNSINESNAPTLPIKVSFGNSTRSGIA